MAAADVRLIPDCKVSVAGSPLETAQDAALTKVLIDLDSDLFGQCQLIFNDPQLALIDGKQFASGTAVEVKIGFASKLVKVFTGEVTALEPQFRRDMPPSLRVICQESLHRLALSHMTRALNDVDDKDVVTKIAQEHGLSAEAPSGTKEHVLQSNVSDATLLRRIAQKSGNVLRIEGKKLIVGPPAKGADVQVEPGVGLRRMRVKIKAQQQVEEVTVHGWDPKSKKEIIGKAKPEGETGEGAKKYGKGDTLAVAGHQSPPSDTATAEAMAKGRLRKIAEGFAVAQGEMVGDPRVVPGAVLALAKISEAHDGSYRIEHAEHTFSKHGYLVKFRAVRVATKKPPSQKAAKDAKDEADKQGTGDDDIADAKDKASHGLINPRWGKQDHDHAEYGEMICDCKNIDGRLVEFVVFHEEPNGNWTEFARKTVIAQGTKVSAKVKLLHEDHPDTPKATKEGSKRPVDEILRNPRWGKTDHDHGEEGEMTVDVRQGYQGQAVIFVVERKGPKGWEQYGTVESKVDGGQARGKLSLLHPASSASSPLLRQPADLRFTAKLQTESGPSNIKFEANVL